MCANIWRIDIVKNTSSVHSVCRHWMRNGLRVFATWALTSVAVVNAGTPAVNLVTAPLVTPSSAWSYYGSGTTHTTGLAAWSTTPPEIQAMAISLGSARYAAGKLTALQYTQNVF